MAIRNTLDFDAASQWVKGAGWRVQYLMAQHFADAARRFCPIDTGALQASIGVETGGVEGSPGQVTASFNTGDELQTVHVVCGGGSVNYAQPVEFGYFHMGGSRWIPPQPFMRNAMADTLGSFSEIVSAAIASIPT